MDLPAPTDLPRRRLLFVDDEPCVVDGLRKSLRPFRARWEVLTATSGAQALLLLEGSSFDALVTDARMPEMNGAQLLRVARERWPEMLRVVLSGEVGKDGPTELTRLAHQFIPKPVAVPALHARLEEALAARQLLASPALKKLVCRLGTLPSLPGTFVKIDRLLEREDATLQQYVEVVEGDLSVCANVLRVVNSAWFGSRTRVASVREAVRLLGFKPLREVVLAAEVFRGAAPEVERLRSAALARLAALPTLLRLLQATEWREIAASAVVLADVGQLVLRVCSPAEAALVEHDVALGRERTEAETRLLGAHHAHLGAVLLKLWSLPPELVEAVALHHAPRSPPVSRSLSTLLALVSTLQQRAAGPSSEQVRLLAEPFGVEDLASLSIVFPSAQEAA